jgi:hypothetical protein
MNHEDGIKLLKILANIQSVPYNLNRKNLFETSSIQDYFLTNELNSFNGTGTKLFFHTLSLLLLHYISDMQSKNAAENNGLSHS